MPQFLEPNYFEEYIFVGTIFFVGTKFLVGPRFLFEYGPAQPKLVFIINKESDIHLFQKEIALGSIFLLEKIFLNEFSLNLFRGYKQV